jgi:hypothetical protein
MSLMVQLLAVMLRSRAWNQFAQRRIVFSACFDVILDTHTHLSATVALIASSATFGASP